MDHSKGSLLFHAQGTLVIGYIRTLCLPHGAKYLLRLEVLFFSVGIFVYTVLKDNLPQAPSDSQIYFSNLFHLYYFGQHHGWWVMVGVGRSFVTDGHRHDASIHK